MSVRCFALSEPRSPPSTLGQVDELLLNGQHQFHRGEDSLNPWQHHHKEGEVQTCHGELLHHPRKEHNIAGVLHYNQWKDQDRPGKCLFQQRHHHHIFSESFFPQTQDALDEKGPHLGVGALNITRKQHHHRESEANTGLTFSGSFDFIGHVGFIEETGSPWLQHHCFSTKLPTSREENSKQYSMWSIHIVYYTLIEIHTNCRKASALPRCHKTCC